MGDQTLSLKPKAQRVRRASINGVRHVLRTDTSKNDPNFVYRWVNDVGDRINLMKELGYEIVTDPNVTVGDRKVESTKDASGGSPVIANVGGGIKAYYMRIPKEWYEEDQKAKAAKIDELEASIKGDAVAGADYGKLEVTRAK